mgnify:FL=1
MKNTKISSEQRETIAMHKIQDAKLNESIFKYHASKSPKDAIEVIRIKKIVNELGIKIWEFNTK